MTPKPSPISGSETASPANANSYQVAPHRSLAEAAAAVATEERGQSLAEWAILSAFLVIALAAVFGVFPYVIASYYREIVEVLSLPLP